MKPMIVAGIMNSGNMTLSECQTEAVLRAWYETYMIVTTDAAKAANDELTDCSVPARDVSIVSTSCTALNINNITYDMLSHLAESIEHTTCKGVIQYDSSSIEDQLTLRCNVVPSHCCSDDRLQESLEQHTRRS